MRILFVLVVFVFVAIGIVLGALNDDLVTYDFGFVSIAVPKGVALLGALIAGWLLGGGTAWLGTSLRRRRQSRAKRSAAGAAAGSALDA